MGWEAPATLGDSEAKRRSRMSDAQLSGGIQVALHKCWPQLLPLPFSLPLLGWTPPEERPGLFLLWAYMMMDKCINAQMHEWREETCLLFEHWLQAVLLLVKTGDWCAVLDSVKHLPFLSLSGPPLHFCNKMIATCCMGISWWLRDKESTCIAGDVGSMLGSGRSLEKEMANHSSILAWEIPWTEKPGRLQSTEWQKSRTWLSIYTTTCAVWDGKGYCVRPDHITSTIDPYVAPQYFGFKPQILISGLQCVTSTCSLVSRPTVHVLTLSFPAGLGFSQAWGTPLPPQPSTVPVLVHNYVEESWNKLYPFQLLSFWMYFQDPLGSCPPHPEPSGGCHPKVSYEQEPRGVPRVSPSQVSGVRKKSSPLKTSWAQTGVLCSLGLPQLLLEWVCSPIWHQVCPGSSWHQQSPPGGGQLPSQPLPW